MYGPKKLQKFRDPWRKPVGFWMDTLCVPVGDDHKKLREQTISQMRQVYEDADRVLVLDDWVEELSVSSSIYEKAVRICLSNWQHRLWTLQEGALAQQLCIQFRDGQKTLDEIKDENYRATENGPSPQFYSGIGRGLAVVPIFNLYFALDLEKEHIPTIGNLFTPLIPAINGRMTTKFEDETVCMATLLSLDSKNLQAISKKRSDRDKMTEEEKSTEDAQICDARMERFLCMVGSFEQRIIFNRLARLRNDGFRWAPRSFLGQSRETLVDTADTRWDRKSRPPEATILNESSPGVEEDRSEAISEKPKRERGGLIVTYPGIKLQTVTPTQLQAGTFYMSRKQHSAFRYRVSLDLPAEYNVECAWLHEAGEYALVTSEVLHKSSRKPIPSVFGVLRGQTKSRICKIRHLCLAAVEAPDQGEAQAQILGGDGEMANEMMPDAERKPSLEIATGIWLNSEQNQWCIL
jgi:hypothetical protein